MKRLATEYSCQLNERSCVTFFGQTLIMQLYNELEHYLPEFFCDSLLKLIDETLKLLKVWDDDYQANPSGTSSYLLYMVINKETRNYKKCNPDTI